MKDSEHFVRFVRDEVVEDDEIMVSFDVKSLFTNVPVDESVKVIHRMFAGGQYVGGEIGHGGRPDCRSTCSVLEVNLLPVQ